MPWFTIENNLILVVILSITIARNQFAVKSFISKLSNFVSQVRYCTIHILLNLKVYYPLFIRNLTLMLHPSKVVFCATNLAVKKYLYICQDTQVIKMKIFNIYWLFCTIFEFSSCFFIPCGSIATRNGIVAISLMLNICQFKIQA